MLRTAFVNLVVLSLLGGVGYAVVQMTSDPDPTPRPAAQKELAAEVPDIAPAVQMKRAVAQPVETGEALLTMRIPRFGSDWEWTALEGTSAEVLVDGPGHYRLTPLPGEKGNSAFAAHRAGHGDPFIDFDLLRPGDEIVLSQGRVEWVYRITMKPRIIGIEDSWVLEPFDEGRWLTLTTCWPKYGSSHRMYVRAILVN